MTSTARSLLPFIRRAAGTFALLLAAGNLQAAGPSLQRSTVERLGTVNGRALACGYADLVARTREIVIAGADKTRDTGELFENATQAAFLAMGREGGACPPREALAAALELAARPLATALPHQLADSRETPDLGLNPRYLLQAATGRAIMDGDFRQHFQLITFGYTYCPDICPTTLLEMAEVMKQLGERADRVQPLFFSLDPERDTLAHLRSYTGFFDRRILGATGSPELVKRAAENFKVRFAKVPAADGKAPYSIDHSAGLYLLAPGGQFIAKFPYGTPVADITARLREEIDKRAAVPADTAPAAPATPPR